MFLPSGKTWLIWMPVTWLGTFQISKTFWIVFFGSIDNPLLGLFWEVIMYFQQYFRHINILYVLYILSHDCIFLKYIYLIQFQYFQGALIMNSKWNYIFVVLSKLHLKYSLKLWFFSQKCIMLQNNWNFQLGDD